MKKICLGLIAASTLALSPAVGQTACPVDFSGTGLSDEQIAMFCAEFEGQMQPASGQSYTYYELVSYYTWASHIDQNFDNSFPDRHPR